CVGESDTGLAPAPLHDIKKIYLATRPARSRRYAAVGGRSRLGDPRFARRIHANLRPRTSKQNCADVARRRRKIFRAADGASRGPRTVVAALSAHRRVV